MKKNVLAVSIAAMIGGLGFAGVASAATVVPSTDVTITPKTGSAVTIPAAETLKV